MPEIDDNDMRSKAQQVQRLATEAEAEALSPDGAVRIVVGPGGNIKDLDLRMNAFQMSGVELGEAIVETLREATERVERELGEQINGLIGMEVDSEPVSGDTPTEGEER